MKAFKEPVRLTEVQIFEIQQRKKTVPPGWEGKHMAHMLSFTW